MKLNQICTFIFLFIYYNLFHLTINEIYLNLRNFEGGVINLIEICNPDNTNNNNHNIENNISESVPTEIQQFNDNEQQMVSLNLILYFHKLDQIYVLSFL